MRPRVARFRSSFYADDAALFINPSQEDLLAVQQILKLFGNVSGLTTNMAKTVAYPIACTTIDLTPMLALFGGVQGTFPCQYLGLLLGVRKPRRSEVQPVLDKIAGKLSPRKERLMNRMGRLVYINSVVTATATYFLTAFQPDKWFTKKVDKLRRNFLWEAEDASAGGKSLVNWVQVCSPKSYGGLGVKNIDCFSRALRLRWEWFRWDEVDRPWKGSPTPSDDTDKQLFSSSSTIQLGDGRLAIFWMDRWLHGEAPCCVAPDIFKLARFKKLSIREALTNGRWMQGLNRMSTEAQLTQFVKLWEAVQLVELSRSKDQIGWSLTANAKYSASSAYDIQFATRIEQPRLAKVWNCRMEGKVKFYIWLLLQNRNWTADRLHKRGGPHNEKCRLCDQEEETAEHLTLRCCFAKETWFQFQGTHDTMCAAASSASSIGDWWRRLCAAPGRRDMVHQEITLAAYIAWHLWKERNRRVFEQKEATAIMLSAMIKEDVFLFHAATDAPPAP